MIFADLFIAVCTLVLASLFWITEPKVFYVYLLLMMRSAGMAFHVPAMQASVPLLPSMIGLLATGNSETVVTYADLRPSDLRPSD